MTTSFSPASLSWDFNAAALFDQLRPSEQQEAVGALDRIQNTWHPDGLPSQLKAFGQDARRTLYLLTVSSSLCLVILEDEAGRSVVDVVRPGQLRQLHEMNKKRA